MFTFWSNSIITKIQKENLVNAEVELQSAKIKLELLASQLTSQGMNKETLNKTIEDTSKALKDAESNICYLILRIF